MTARQRLTASLLLTGDVAREIDGIRRALGAAALQRIPPHLTLVPPVNVREDELEEAVAVLRAAAKDSHPLRLQLGPPASFRPTTPVVYLSVAGDLEGVTQLRRHLLAGPLERHDERSFVPHVTLDQNIDPARIDGALETLSAYRAETTVEDVTLLAFDEPSRRWLTYATVALGRPRIVGRGGLEVELSLSRSLDPAGEAFKESEWAAYSRQTYGEDANDEAPFAITARIGGEIVGTATGQIRGPLCRLANLVVAAHWRSNGIGSQLLRSVEKLARERGAEIIRLETREGGPAEQLYRQRGFVAVAPLPAWREGRDFLLMERRLS